MISASIAVGQPTGHLPGHRCVLVGSGWLEQERTHGYVEALLLARHPDADVTIRNLAWGGDTVRGTARTSGYQHPDGFARLVKEIQDQKPTLILLAYGMNESFDGTAGLASFRDGYEQLLAKLAPLKARIILLSPTYHEDLGRPLPDPSEHNRQVVEYGAAIRQLAAKHGLTYVDLFEPLRAAKQANRSRRLTTNGLLLTGAGHAIVARAIAAQPGLPAWQWRVDIDAHGKAAAVGTRVRNLDTAGGKVRFEALDEGLPMTDGGDVQYLRVSGLPAGDYALTIDGERVTRATAAQWAAGVKLTTGPAYRAAEKLREAIVRKNELFYRRWRPFNDHSRHWGFMKGDYALYDKDIAVAERVIAEARRPRPHVYVLSATGDAK